MSVSRVSFPEDEALIHLAQCWDHMALHRWGIVRVRIVHHDGLVTATFFAKTASGAIAQVPWSCTIEELWSRVPDPAFCEARAMKPVYELLGMAREHPERRVVMTSLVCEVELPGVAAALVQHVERAAHE